MVPEAQQAGEQQPGVVPQPVGQPEHQEPEAGTARAEAASWLARPVQEPGTQAGSEQEPEAQPQ